MNEKVKVLSWGLRRAGAVSGFPRQEKGSVVMSHVGKSRATRMRDIEELESLALVARYGKKFKGSMELLKGHMLMRRKK